MGADTCIGATTIHRKLWVQSLSRSELGGSLRSGGGRMGKRVSRRDITRVVPLLMMGSAFGGFARLLAACASEAESPTLARRQTAPTHPTVPPTDSDELVAGPGTPVVTGSAPPTVPNQAWEARVSQLEAQQT